MVCRNSAMRERLVEVLTRQSEEHGVDPLAVLEIRAPLDALAHVAGPLGVRDRALVEAIDLQLDPVEAEVVEQKPLEQACRLDADPPFAEARMNREPPGRDDPVLLADALERDAAGAFAVDLDHVPAEFLART